MKRRFLGAQPSCLHVVLITTLLAIPMLSQPAFAGEVEDVYDRVKHGYADSGGVKIHYAMLGPASERAHNEEQKANTAYAQRFRQEDAARSLTAEGLAGRIKDPRVRERYVEAFRRSDFEAMLNYYKQNYPAPPYLEDTSPVV